MRAAAVRSAGLVAALAAGWSATVRVDGASWFGVRGPQCPLGACLGPLVCPGCGLLRSTAAALQGDFAFAFAAHPAGPVVAVLLLGGAVVHFDILRRRREEPVHRHWRLIGQRAFVIALLAGWLGRALTAH
jgi:hypothetical protein